MRNIDIFSWEPEADKDVFFHRDKFRNKKVHHMYMDTELNYQNIRNSFPKHLQELYDTPIEYKWNNDTFRDYREFSESNDGHIAIGDSFTEGEGVPYNMIWHRHLEKYLGEPIYNLGMCGTGFDEWFLVLLRYMHKFTGDKIFMLTHSYSRFNFPGKEYYMNPVHVADLKKIWYEWFVNDNYILYNYQIKLLAIKQLAQSRNKQLYFINLNDIIQDEDTIPNNHKHLNFPTWFYDEYTGKPKWDLARDGKHLGPNFHEEVYRRFTKLLE